MRKPSLNRAELMLLGLMVHRSIGPHAFDPDEACILGRSLGVPEDRADAVRAIFDASVDPGELVDVQEWRDGQLASVLDANRQVLRGDLLPLLTAPAIAA
jgi:hypothetical protein